MAFDQKLERASDSDSDLTDYAHMLIEETTDWALGVANGNRRHGDTQTSVEGKELPVIGRDGREGNDMAVRVSSPLGVECKYIHDRGKDGYSFSSTFDPYTRRSANDRTNETVTKDIMKTLGSDTAMQRKQRPVDNFPSNDKLNKSAKVGSRVKESNCRQEANKESTHKTVCHGQLGLSSLDNNGSRSRTAVERKEAIPDTLNVEFNNSPWMPTLELVDALSGTELHHDQAENFGLEVTGVRTLNGEEMATWRITDSGVSVESDPPNLVNVNAADDSFCSGREVLECSNAVDLLQPPGLSEAGTSLKPQQQSQVGSTEHCLSESEMDTEPSFEYEYEYVMLDDDLPLTGDPDVFHMQGTQSSSHCPSVPFAPQASGLPGTGSDADRTVIAPIELHVTHGDGNLPPEHKPKVVQWSDEGIAKDTIEPQSVGVSNANEISPDSRGSEPMDFCNQVDISTVSRSLDTAKVNDASRIALDAGAPASTKVRYTDRSSFPSTEVTTVKNIGDNSTGTVGTEFVPIIADNCPEIQGTKSIGKNQGPETVAKCNGIATESVAHGVKADSWTSKSTTSCTGDVINTEVAARTRSVVRGHEQDIEMNSDTRVWDGSGAAPTDLIGQNGHHLATVAASCQHLTPAASAAGTLFDLMEMSAEVALISKHLVSGKKSSRKSQPVERRGMKLRRVKERKTYTDQDIDDDEIEGKRSYSIEEKLASNRYNKEYVVTTLKGEEFNLKYLQENGLQKPILFQEKSGLGLRVPSENFQVSDVKQCVGSRRMLDVMDVTTQTGMEMSMKEWVRYYENAERDRLLNVISLEFSHTKLENYVESPTLVRQIDWVDIAWPQHLKDCQTEATNIIDKMKYPKVQKYCLMSVAGCYTDFHIDFGGTSVWYHVLHGKKVFWLIPPVQRNLELYEDWVLSGKQGDLFLADMVADCQRVTLTPGNTFIIPSGWIHAVFTPKDSLVFGGNFIHSFNIVNQLRATAIEDRTHVPGKFRYPFYTEISWYVLERYVHCLTGKTYLEKPQLSEDLKKLDSPNPNLSEKEATSPDSPSMEDIKTEVNLEPVDSASVTPKLPKRVAISLTRIDQSPRRKSSSDDDSTASTQPGSPSTASLAHRSFRKSSSDSVGSLPETGAVKMSTSDNEKDSRPSRLERDDSGAGPDRPSRSKRYVYLTPCELKGLRKLVDWLDALPSNKKNVPKDMFDSESVMRNMKKILEDHATDDPVLAASGEPVLVWPPATKKLLKLKQKAKMLGSTGALKVKPGKGGQAGSSSIRHRRTRCKKCEPCTRTDCGECNFCKDMKKYGGPGRMKQSCISRQCLAPILPNTALCMVCKEDHHVRDEDTGESYSTLMECGICWEIVHPDCLKQTYENLEYEGVINEDLPNSWKCPKCCGGGREGQLKSRVFKGLPKGVKPHSDNIINVQVTDDPGGYLPLQEDSAPEGKRVTVKQEKTPVKSVSRSPHRYREAASPSPMGSDTQDSFEPKLEPKSEPNETKPYVHHSLSPRIGRPPKHSPSPKPARRDRSSSTSPPPRGRAPLKPRVSPRRSLQSIMKRRPSSGHVQTATAIKKRRLSSLSGSPRGRGRGLDIPKTQSKGAKTLKSPKPPKPVITRSGRTVKRSPTLRDENLSTPDSKRKRPRREGLATPDRQQTSTSYNMDVQDDSSQSHWSPLVDRARGRGGVRGKSPKSAKKSLSRGRRLEEGPGLEVGRLYPEASTSTDVTPEKHHKHTVVRKKPERLDKTLLEHIQKRQLKVVLQKYVVRPAPISPPKSFVKLDSGDIHKLSRKIWMKIFSYLPPADLARCLSVCRTWDGWCISPDLWKHINVSRRRIMQKHLMGIVRRQPESLNLTSVTMTQKQLTWLVERLPLLKTLNLSKCSWATISGLCISSCPLLHSLDVSWASDLNEQCFEDLLTPPVDGKPAVQNISRLHRLKDLNVAGTEVTDRSLELITVHLPRLESLDVSYCTRISDKGIQVLTSPRAAVQDTLRALSLAGCRQLREGCLDLLETCRKLQKLNIVACSNFSPERCRHFTMPHLQEYKW